MPQPLRYDVTKNGTADWQTLWLDFWALQLAQFQVSWTAVAATAGTLQLQGTNDQAQAAGSILSFDNSLLTWWGNGPTVAATASTTMLAVASPMRFHRLIYTRGAGGGADQFTIACIGR